MKKITLITLIFIFSYAYAAEAQDPRKILASYKDVKWQVNYNHAIYSGFIKNLNENCDKILALLKDAKANTNNIERFQFWDYYIPRTAKDYAELGIGKNVLFMVAGFTHNKNELPITLIVNGKSYPAIAGSEYKDPRINSRVIQVFGSHKSLYLYLIPLVEFYKKGEIVLDWNTGRKGSYLFKLPVDVNFPKEIGNTSDTSLPSDSNLLIAMRTEYGFYPRNKLDSFSIYKQACDNKNSQACNSIGVDEEKSNHINVAFQYYNKACQLGLVAGCSNAAAICYKQGKIDEAIKGWTSACNQRYGVACKNLGAVAYEKNDYETMAKFFKRACQLGEESACAFLKSR